MTRVEQETLLVKDAVMNSTQMMGRRVIKVFLSEGEYDTLGVTEANEADIEVRRRGVLQDVNSFLNRDWIGDVLARIPTGTSLKCAR